MYDDTVRVNTSDTQEANLAIGMFCPRENVDKVSAETVQRCENPSNQSLEDNTLYFSIKHRTFYRNYFCLKCHDVSTNDSDIRKIPPIRNCSMEIRDYLLKSSEDNDKKIEIYITQCLPTISITINNYLYNYNSNSAVPSGMFLFSLRECHPAQKLFRRLPLMSNASLLENPTAEWLCSSAYYLPVCSNTTTYFNVFCAVLDNETDYRCTDCEIHIRQTKGPVPLDLPPMSILLDYNSKRFVKSTSFSSMIDCSALTSREVDEGLCLMKQCKEKTMPYHLDFLQENLCANPMESLQGEIDVDLSNISSFSDAKFLMTYVCNLILRFTQNDNKTLEKFCHNITVKRIGAPILENVLIVQSSAVYLNIFGRQIDGYSAVVNFFTYYTTQGLRSKDLMIKIKENVKMQSPSFIYKTMVDEYNYTMINLVKLTFKNGFPELCKNDTDQNHGTLEIVNLAYNISVISKHTEKTCLINYNYCKSTLYRLLDSSRSNDQIMMQMQKIYGGQWHIIANNKILHIDCTVKRQTETIIKIFNSIIIYICIPTSILGLIVTSIIYGCYKELHSIPCMCTVNLAACNILQLATFFATTLLRGRMSITGPLCQIMAIANHLFTLLTFTWCSTLSIMAVKAFSSMSSKITSSSLKKQRRFLKFIASGYIPAIMYTTVCTISAYTSYESWAKIKYGQTKSGMCILANEPMASILIGITLPAVVLITISIVNYALVIASILKSVKATKSVRNEDDNGKIILLKSGMRLGVLLGFAWILPMFGIVLNSDVISAIGNALLATQGIFLSVSLLSSSQVQTLIKRTRRIRKF